MNDQEFYRRIRRLVGRRCRHLGRHCMLIDVLAEEGVLVLRCDDGAPPIQGDQFGHATRRAVETLEIPLFSDSQRETLSEDVLELLTLLESRAA